MPPQLEFVLHLPVIYKYVAILFIAFFEGPLISLASGFLVYTGFLSIIPAYIVLVLGDIIPDIFYYFAGRFGAKTKFVIKYRTRFPIIGNHLEIAKKLWQRHPGKTMLLTKFAYGLSTPLLISSGLVGMPVKKFMKNAFPITFGQHILTMSLGFFLGNSFEIADKYIKNLGIFVTIAALIFAGIFYFIQRLARKKIEEMERENGN